MLPSAAWAELANSRGSDTLAGSADPARLGTPPKSAPTTPTFSEVSVHDPSIVKAGDTFYVFGSHIEAAKSTDLMNWTGFTNGYTTPGNTLYGDLSGNLAGSFAWAGENDSDSSGGFAVWAPDVFWNPDFVNKDGTRGAYLIYYSASSTYIRSAIGVASSPTIEGPYEYVDTIIYSGFTRNEAYDANSTINKQWTNTNIKALVDNGTLDGAGNWFNADGSYKNSAYPNAIDPAHYYDKDGKLWMAYGSWSGGIFALEIDPATGLPKYPGSDGTTADGRPVDRYFGTLIAGGFTKSGEGPYIVYDRRSGYYYLYMTYGGLAANGGYNMRQFRSTSPTGPYVDAQGQSAVLPGNTSNDPYGNKLMGNYLFERLAGDPGTGIGVGYVSPGHNSVYQDESTGRQFLIFHTRFPQQGEYHEVRVHQMFMNEDNWPVAAPFRYAGETLEAVGTSDIAGEYKFVSHGKSTSPAIERSVYITLNNNHTITGDKTGRWQKRGPSYSEIEIDGETYKGVFVRGWDPDARQFVMTFTAMSDQGVSVWGVRQQDLTDREVVANVLNDIDLGDTAQVSADLILPSEGTRHAVITWQTSDDQAVESDGTVHRPTAGSEPATAVLTATVAKGSVTDSRAFTVTVLPRQTASLTANYAFEGGLQDQTGSFGAGTVTGNRIDNTGGAITYAAGISGQAAVFNGSSGIRLPDDLIDGDSYSVSLWVKPEALSTYTTTFFGARDPNHWISLLPQGPANGNTMLWSGSDPWYDAPTGMTIGIGEWSHLAITAEKGAAKVYVNGVERFSGTSFPDIFSNSGGSFALGVNWWDPPFQGMLDDLRVYNGTLTPEEIAALSSSSNL
ncbi:family 43 glycosylhydrolase [Cohnella lubricantis]|uniref:Family 43 glycosylhydrolase n=2 Tax=Cohnella lubricantis TaxID=2163172 RepID=A0A841TE81_9BACL|nr:family 43 glycosylhydrolase [Cohnella lubricantis]